MLEEFAKKFSKRSFQGFGAGKGVESQTTENQLMLGLEIHREFGQWRCEGTGLLGSI